MNRQVAAWLALVIGLVLTVLASLEVKQAIEQDAKEGFAFTSDQVTLKIQERLDAYALILKGGAGLFAASDSVSRREWQAYVEKLRAQDSIPGVQGIGFSQVIPAQQLAAHIAKIRAEGFPDYTVRPAGERALYTSIIYLEPFRDRNLRAFGFDMFSEPVRRAAMEQARDSGAPALSGKVELVQETGTEVQAGTLMYVPVYRNGAPTGTVEQRRAALLGWAYSPYRMKDLLEGILAHWDEHKIRRVHLHIYAGAEVKADSLLYDSRPDRTQKVDPLFYQQRTVDFNGQHWLLAFHAGEGVAPISYANAWATLAGGIVLSSLLSGLMLALARTQVRVREIADNLTEELRESKKFLNATLDGLSAHIAVLNDRGEIVLTNKAYRDFGTQNAISPRTVFEGSNYLAVCDGASGEYSEEAAPFAQGIREVLSGKRQSFELEYPCHSPSEERWFIARVTSFVDGGRQVIVAHENITKRKQAEEALRESVHLVKAIIHFAQDIIVFKDSNFVFRLVNPAFCNLVGKTEEEIIGKTDFDLFPDELARKYRIDDKSVIEAGQYKSLEEEIPTDNGIRYLSTTKVQVLSENKAIQGIAIIIRDFTERKHYEQALLQERDSIRNILATVEAMIVALDPEGRITLVNRKACEILGYHEDELIGQDWFATCLPCSIDVEQVREVFKQFQAGNLAVSEYYEKPVRTRSGDERLIAWHNSSNRDKDGNIIGGLLSAGEDITERKQVEGKLQLAASVFVHAREGILITDAEANIIDVNAAFSYITGYPREEVIGRNTRLLSSGRQSTEFYAAMWHDLIAQGFWQGEVWNRRRDGEVYAELLTLSAVRDAAGQTQYYVALFADITEQKQYQQRLEHIAHYDALTGLPNRVLLADRLHQSMAQTLRRHNLLAVAFLDLDGFKAINDNHGHERGDQLLMTVASRMKQAVRDGDTVARLGGDEFVAVMQDLTDIEDSVPFLLRLLEAAAKPVYVDNLTLQVSASVGVSFYPLAEEGVDADQLLRQADQAMYQAKLSGKNRYHIFDAEQDRSVRDHHESLERIKQALAEREFVLYYQPKVNMRTGDVIGAEALIRWQHPERGVLPPGLFLPLIADHSLAIEIGEWVLDSAMQQIEDWKAVGLSLPVSVNIDVIQLEQADFIDRLRQQVAAHPGLVASDLELEVLETSALNDFTQVSAVIRACHEMGVGFALDDFGTGYSSLTYLKRLPAGMLKIDQSFVRDMLDDPDDLAILSGVFGLATSFRRQAIAEGVETVAHGEMLLQLGCELGQGYAIARPMPAEDIPVWLAAWRPDSSWLNQMPISRDDLPILFASVEHRAWFIRVVSFIRGEGDTPPPLHHDQCRFGQWLKAEVRVRKENRLAIEALASLHIEIHSLASELIRKKQEGQVESAMARLIELYPLRDRLLENLLDMLR
jgi:diguanylate cyclase (GGDEF)-like protein/PAS domain S-box-containing protein